MQPVALILQANGADKPALIYVFYNFSLIHFEILWLFISNSFNDY